jgi:hypothetical protein
LESRKDSIETKTTTITTTITTTSTTTITTQPTTKGTTMSKLYLQSIECSAQPLDLSFHPTIEYLVAAALVDGTVEGAFTENVGW